MVDTASKLTDNIKKQLSSRSMSVSELERRAGLKQSTLQNILYGRSKNPSIDTIKSIAKELNCSIEELIGELNYINPTNRVPNEDEKEKVEECVWNARLFIKAIEIIEAILSKKNVTLPKKQILASVDEVYKYSIGISDEIDLRFAEWIIDKILRKEKE